LRASKEEGVSTCAPGEKRRPERARLPSLKRGERKSYLDADHRKSNFVLATGASVAGHGEKKNSEEPAMLSEEAEDTGRHLNRFWETIRRDRLKGAGLKVGDPAFDKNHEERNLEEMKDIRASS